MVNVERNMNIGLNVNVGGTLETGILKVGEWYLEVLAGGELYIHK